MCIRDSNRTKPEVCSGLLKYDSIHGKFNAKIEYDEKHLIINKNKITFSQETNLNKINWLKNNSIWQQRVIINGRVVKNNNSIILASNVIKKALGIKLDVKEKVIESKVKKSGK